jgi:hypothetical protein
MRAANNEGGGATSKGRRELRNAALMRFEVRPKLTAKHMKLLMIFRFLFDQFRQWREHR